MPDAVLSTLHALSQLSSQQLCMKQTLRREDEFK